MIKAAIPLKTNDVFVFENSFYEPMNEISKYTQKLYLTTSKLNSENVYIVKELKEVFVIREIFFFCEGLPCSKKVKTKATIVEVIQKPNEG